MFGCEASSGTYDKGADRWILWKGVGEKINYKIYIHFYKNNTLTSQFFIHMEEYDIAYTFIFVWTHIKNVI